MSENNFLSAKDLINEKILRDIILFLLLFFLILNQGWENLLLLLFPLVTFSFALFFNILGANKWRTEFKSSQLLYNPLGSEKKNGNRLNFSTLFQLILIFWIGHESIFHPQLIEGYSLYFMTIFVFIYSFGFCWIFLDLWKYARTELIFGTLTYEEAKLNKNNLDYVLSFLKVKNFKRINHINVAFLLLINILNILFSYLAAYGNFLAFDYVLPGTGIESSDPVNLTLITYMTLIIPPLLMVFLFMVVYKDINEIKSDKLQNVLAPLPKNVQLKISENLKLVNSKIRLENKIE